VIKLNDDRRVLMPPNLMIRCAVAVSLTLIISTVGACSSSGGSSNDSSNDPASLLAQRDGSSDVATYSAALDAWQAKCTEDRVTDAGYVDAAYQDEQKNNGPDASRLAVMRHLTASVPASAAPTKCDSVAAAYLVLVEN
jgi:hypothetical protein